MSEEVRYNAFISYRHCEPDKTIAKALHKKLENYRIPKELREKLSRNVLGRVFRDEAELPVTDSLSDAILDALRNSEFLIVICSPRLKDSAWCMKEIEIFTKLHGKKNILPVLIEGEPEESFPESFFYEDVTEKDPEGNEVVVRIDKEPLAADARGGRRSLPDCVIKLSAAILKLNYDDLKQRHRLEQLKRRTFVTSIIMGIILLFLVQSLFFISTIQEQSREIERKYADSMAQNADELFDLGYRMDALYLARSVLPDKRGDNVSGDAFRALVNASEIYSKDIYVPTDMITGPVITDTALFSANGKKVIIGNINIGRYYVLDTDSKETSAAVSTDISTFAFYKDEGLFYMKEDNIFYLDLNSNEVTALDELCYFIPTPTGEEVIGFTDDGICAYRGNEVAYTISAGELGTDFIPEWFNMETVISKDGKLGILLVRDFEFDINTDWVILFDVKKGKVINSVKSPFDGMVDAMAVDETGASFLYRTSNADGSIGERYLCNYDVRNERVLAELNVGKEYFNILERYDGEIIIGTDNRIAVYDKELELLGGFGVPSFPMSVKRIEDHLAVVDLYGEIYSVSEESIGYALTEDLFGTKEKNLVLSFDVYNGKIYINYNDADGVSVYSRSEGIAFTDSEEIDEEELFTGVSDEEQILGLFRGKEDFDQYMYSHGVLSDDGAYYAITMLDESVHIYDSKTLEEKKVFYDISGYIMQFTYLDKIDCYALVNGSMELLDRSFEHVASIDGVWYVKDDRGRLIVMKNDFSFYEIKLFSYEETLEYADRILGDYVPSERICDKYGL